MRAGFARPGDRRVGRLGIRRCLLLGGHNEAGSARRQRAMPWPIQSPSREAPSTPQAITSQGWGPPPPAPGQARHGRTCRRLQGRPRLGRSSFREAQSTQRATTLSAGPAPLRATGRARPAARADSLLLFSIPGRRRQRRSARREELSTNNGSYDLQVKSSR